MKVRNKKTGEIGNLLPYGGEDGKIWVWIGNISRPEYRYNSLAELNEEWEDYEEPKGMQWVDVLGANDGRVVIQYSNEKEAEKVVEKLKAWKRLKEARFEFGGWTHTPITKSLTGYNLHIKAYSDKLADYMDDLQLLFGGEE